VFDQRRPDLGEQVGEGRAVEFDVQFSRIRRC
jgi:hypothetical protein